MYFKENLIIVVVVVVVIVIVIVIVAVVVVVVPLLLLVVVSISNLSYQILSFKENNNLSSGPYGRLTMEG